MPLQPRPVYLLSAPRTAFGIIKWAGAVYLVGVGLNTLVRRPDAVLAIDHLPRRRAFSQGVIVNVLNPKVALFFLSYLPQFVDESRGPAWSQVLTLGVVFVVIGSIATRRGRSQRVGCATRYLKGRSLAFVQRWVSGSVFVALGVLRVAHRVT